MNRRKYELKLLIGFLSLINKTGENHNKVADVGNRFHFQESVLLQMWQEEVSELMLSFHVQLVPLRVANETFITSVKTYSEIFYDHSDQSKSCGKILTLVTKI